jgi:hypothetical protein
MLLINIGINRDDGLLIGAGFKRTKQEGFRKTPFASQYQIMITHSFSINAFRANYKGDWILVNDSTTLGSDRTHAGIDEYSHRWPNGTGIGLYFSPAQLAVIQIVDAHSVEGWYPYFSLGSRI